MLDFVTIGNDHERHDDPIGDQNRCRRSVRLKPVCFVQESVGYGDDSRTYPEERDVPSEPNGLFL